MTHAAAGCPTAAPRREGDWPLGGGEAMKTILPGQHRHTKNINTLVLDSRALATATWLWECSPAGIDVLGQVLAECEPWQFDTFDHNLRSARSSAREPLVIAKRRDQLRSQSSILTLSEYDDAWMEV